MSPTTSPFPEPPLLLNFLVVMFVFAGMIVFVITQHQATTQQRKVADYLDAALHESLNFTVIVNSVIQLHETIPNIVTDTLDDLTTQRRKLVPTTATIFAQLRSIDDSNQLCPRITSYDITIDLLHHLSTHDRITVAMTCQADHTEDHFTPDRYEVQYCLKWLPDQPLITSAWVPVTSTNIFTA